MMKRILALLILAVCLSEAQVQSVYWSKKSAEDTAKTAWGPNLGFLGKFITFPDGTKMLTAAGLSDTTKYLEKIDSLAMPGYATRTMLGKDSTYARAIFALDTTYKAAQLLTRIKYADSTNSPGYVTRTQFRADSVYARAIFALDTTYKAAQLLTRIPYSDTTSALVKQWIFVRDSLYRAAQEALKVTKADSSTMPGYVTRTAFANDSTYARAIFALDTTYKAAQLLTRVKYSDTTSTVAMQWELDGKIAKSDTSAFPSIVPARDGQQGWLKRNATTPQSGTVSLATATDSLLLGSQFIIGNADSTGGFNFVRTDKNVNRSTQVQAIDTSSVFLLFTQSGKPQFSMRDNNGYILFTIDSIGTITSTYSDLYAQYARLVNGMVITNRCVYESQGDGLFDIVNNTTPPKNARGTIGSIVLQNQNSQLNAIAVNSWNIGATNFSVDTLGNVVTTGFVDHQGTNSATVTAGAGDSIQVSVTGVTATSQIVATYATATALTDIPPAIVNKQTGMFTIYATNTKTVTYWIAKK